MPGVTGGSIPARIWRDFMRGALKLEAAPRPRAPAAPDPEGPVQQLDIEGAATPPGPERASQPSDGNGATPRPDGVPGEMRADQGGAAVQPTPAPGAPPP
jgi:penicillin-binding protein 1A